MLCYVKSKQKKTTLYPLPKIARTNSLPSPSFGDISSQKSVNGAVISEKNTRLLNF
jgi:hypothetical protein